MLGTRGVRLGVIKPGLYAMQVRALMQAADQVADEGYEPIVEVMIPLTVTREELALARGWVEGVLVEHSTRLKEVERIQELEQTADEVAIKARVAALRSQRVN